jgi:hypothetical protein
VRKIDMLPGWPSTVALGQFASEIQRTDPASPNFQIAHLNRIAAKMVAWRRRAQGGKAAIT